jgi:vitamin B12 transporter
MNKQITIIGALAISLASTSVFAQKTQEKKINLTEVVISATKFKLAKEKVGKVITKITQQEIQNNAGKTVLELLNNITGIEIKGLNSNSGDVKGIYIRGGRSRQVLVLIDGVPVSDPTGISQEFDLRLLSLNQIESIEVLKGASSTLYGSGAATGVINIILKKASKEEVSLSYEASLGTSNTANSNSLRLLDKNQNLSVRGTVARFNYLGTINVTATDGFSSAKSNTGKSFTNDAYTNKSGLFKLGYTFSDNVTVQTFLNFDEFEYQYDGGAYTDALENSGDQKQFRVGVKPTFNYDKGNLFAIASYNNVKRDVSGNAYEGKSIHLEVVNKYDFNTNLQLITGVNYQDHSNQTNSPWGNIDASLATFNTLDAYATAVYSTDFNLTINAGGRLNKHSKYGSHFVYHVNPSYNVYATETATLKLLTSYSTAYISPSLYQLFSVYGNLNLEPETNETFELGFESTYKKWLEISTVFFNRTEENAVIFKGLSAAPWGQYANAITTIKVKGVEASVTLKPYAFAKLYLGYTYIDKDAEARYIPKNKFVANLEFTPFENTFFSLVYKNVGEREGAYYDASIFTTIEKTLPLYHLLDINASYKLLDETVTLFGSLTNVFNEDYEETLGFNTRGRNFKVGVRFQF